MAEYNRVIPRDLFNESKLLKCYGQLSLLILDAKVDCLPLELQHNPIPFPGFDVQMDGMRAHFYCNNLHLVLDGKRRIWLGCPINDKSSWPMVFVRDNDSEDEVFNEQGRLSDEFKAYCRHLLEG